jgi:hypothetical protein
MAVSPVVAADETRGRLIAIFPDKREVVVADSADREMTFQLAQDAKVMINNAESNLSNLEPGDTVVVVYEGEQPIAKQIRCKRD